jgi:7-carboxy-7-deazaguanine synthase
MVKQFRVAEIFGPTIQGEGRNAGRPCVFVRFGGCDYRCSWCDSPHAVLPEEVAKLEKMTPHQIERTVSMSGRLHVKWIVLSGGNPALLDLWELVERFHQRKKKVMLETQGSVWADWLMNIDDLCISPKGPSSGNITPLLQLQETFLDRWFHAGYRQHMGNLPYLKCVVFDDADYEYAQQVHSAFPEFDFYLSVGTPVEGQPTVGNPNPSSTLYTPEWTKEKVMVRFKWLAERAANDPRMNDAKVLPQLHVLAWGVERGH